MEDNKEKIIGKWMFESSAPDTVETSDPSVTKEIEDELMDEADKDAIFFMEFKADGTCAIVEELISEGIINEFDFTYSINDENLTLVQDNVIRHLKIVQLEKNKLILIDDDTEAFKDVYPEVKINKVTSIQNYKK